MGQKDTNVRMSLQTLRVLEVFLENPTEPLAAADVHQRCGIASGTLYPILLRLESAGGLSASGNPLSHRAARAPACLSSRLEEEWLADLESRFSALSRLRFAAGCCWAALVIVNDYPRSRVPAASAVLTAKGFSTLADRHFGYFSLRSGTLFLIAGLYARFSAD